MSNKTNPRLKGRLRRKTRIRKKITGTESRPRLTVFRSSKHIYAQVVDDSTGKTVCAASSLKDQGEGYTGNKDAAAVVGKALAERAVSAGITEVVFDRNGFKYHGRVKALADAAREGGLKF